MKLADEESEELSAHGAGSLIAMWIERAHCAGSDLQKTVQMSVQEVISIVAQLTSCCSCQTVGANPVGFVPIAEIVTLVSLEGRQVVLADVGGLVLSNVPVLVGRHRFCKVGIEVLLGHSQEFALR